MAQVGLYFWSIAFNCGNQRQTSNLIHLKYSRFGKFGAVPPLQTAFDLFFWDLLSGDRVYVYPSAVLQSP
jgi:hypothetical protein